MTKNAMVTLNAGEKHNYNIPESSLKIQHTKSVDKNLSLCSLASNQEQTLRYIFWAQAAYRSLWTFNYKLKSIKRFQAS